jgi:hypothetical protein
VIFENWVVRVSNKTEMEKTAYIVSYQGNPVAVITAGDDFELTTKLGKAIQEEASAEEDGQLEVSIDRIGDWGETIPVKAKYVKDGFLVDDNEFSLMKTVVY